MIISIQNYNMLGSVVIGFDTVLNPTESQFTETPQNWYFSIYETAWFVAVMYVANLDLNRLRLCVTAKAEFMPIG